jgi:phosphoribosylformylglycinamidine (FGAM) synthase PurS component
MPSPKKLGTHLEWHGNRIRVVIRVPPSMIAKMGKGKLKETLDTTDPLEAEREKVDVIKRLRASLQGTRATAIQTSLTEQALEVRRLREAGQLRMAVEDDDGDAEEDALQVTVEAIERQHGTQEAERFAAVVLGIATPLTSLVDRWFAEKDLSIGYKEDIRRALARLEAWCGRTRTPKTVEAITQRMAGRYIHDQFVSDRVDVKTANKDLSCLRSYWKWLGKRHGTEVNPWAGQSLEKPKQRREAASAKKRPFTDEEVRRLLAGIRSPREREFSMMSALSGLRLEEVAGLRVQVNRTGFPGGSNS